MYLEKPKRLIIGMEEVLNKFYVAFRIPVVLHSCYHVFIYADIPIQLYTVMGKQSSAGQLHFGLAKFGSE